MKMVVIGSGGFLGSRVAAHYDGTCELFTPSHRELDITDRGSVERYLGQIRPDVIIQCAAVSDVGICGQEPEWSRRINVDGSVHVAWVGSELGAKCILCSSDQVYFGSPVAISHLETEVLLPENEYGRQKLNMEWQCPDAVLLRLSWMYDSRKLRREEHGNFLLTLLEDLKEGRELTFPIYDRRGITDVAQVVENLDKALDLPWGVYNFGSGNDQSTYETMETVFAKLGMAPPMVKNTRAFADRPRNLCMNTEKIESFGIHFSTTAEGLCKALKEKMR